jgi:hypothetical protein
MTRPTCESLESRSLFSVAPAFELFVDAGLTQPGVVGSYANVRENQIFPPSGPRQYIHDDLRNAAGITVSGTRVDAAIDFPTNNWTTPAGGRAQLGLTGGSDQNWDLFVTQWDGRVRINEAGTRLSLISPRGSRMWVDADNNGAFNSATELSDNGFNVISQDVAEGHRTARLPAGVYRIRVQFVEDYFINTIRLAASPLRTFADLEGFESRMLFHAEQHRAFHLGEPVTGQNAAERIFQYDPSKVYWQLYDYNGDPKWLGVARAMTDRYIDLYINGQIGQVNARNNFLEGLRIDWERETDPTRKGKIRAAIVRAAETGEYARDTTPLSQTQGLVPTGPDAAADAMRVVSRVIEAYLDQYLVTGTVRDRLAPMVNQSIGHLTEFAEGSYLTDPNVEIPYFWAALAAKALIRYQDIFGVDTRIMNALNAAAEAVWVRGWRAVDEAFLYSNKQVVPDAPTTARASADLNNMYTSWFLRQYQETGDADFRDRAHMAFEGGVRYAYMGETQGTPPAGLGAKQFRESHWAVFPMLRDRGFGPGDANRDRAVGVADLGALATNYNRTRRTFAEGDFNYSGTTDVADLGLLATAYGRTFPRPTALVRQSVPAAGARALRPSPVAQTLRLPAFPKPQSGITSPRQVLAEELTGAQRRRDAGPVPT